MKYLMWAVTFVLAAVTSARAATMNISTGAHASPCLSGSTACNAQTALQNQILNLDAVDTLTAFDDQRFAMTSNTDRGYSGLLREPIATGSMVTLLGLRTEGDSETGPTLSGFIPTGGTILLTRDAVKYTLPDAPETSERPTAEVPTDAPMSGSEVSSPEPVILVLLGLGLAGLGIAARYGYRASRRPDVSGR
jgi:hypothetical protein